MLCPTLAEIPPPPTGRTGWPWTEEAEQLSGRMLSEKHCPRVSIVTPSYNQGQFVEETIRSVLLQGYPNLEYIIVDGGSTDETLDIVEKYEPWLAYWVSEPDTGMYDAINKGFAQATGAIMAWSNTDDVYLPGALQAVGSVFHTLPEVEWLTSLWKVQWDENSREIRRYQVKGFSRKAFYRGRNLLGSNPYASFMIQQQSTFWRRELWDRAGGRVDDTLGLAGDFELWARFFKYADLYGLNKPLGVFRFQPDQKTARQSLEYLQEAEEAFKSHGGCYPSVFEGRLRSGLLKRIPSRLLKHLPGLAYVAHIVGCGEDHNWRTRKRFFV